MYDRLQSLPANVSPFRRTALLFSVTDLMIRAGEHASSEMATTYSQIVAGMLPVLSLEERAALADAIADMSNVEPDLVRLLASGEADIATPVLRRSILLDDADLIAVASDASMQHLSAIAARTRLSEAVSDALLARGDGGIVRALAANHGARFSAAGLSRLIQEASAVLAPEEKGKLLPFHSQTVSNRIRRPAPEGTGIVVPLHRPAASDEAAADGECEPIAKVIATIASEDRMLEIASLLARAASQPAERVRRLIAQSDAMPLAVLCRAAGVSTKTFAVIAAIHGRRFGRSATEVLGLVQQFKAFDPAEARRLAGKLSFGEELRSAGTGKPAG